MNTYTVLIISRSVLRRMRNVPDESCRGNQNTHFVFSNFFFLLKLFRLGDNVEKCGTVRQATDDTVRRMRIPC
jgi:hypothetical protein